MEALVKVEEYVIESIWSLNQVSSRMLNASWKRFDLEGEGGGSPTIYIGRDSTRPRRQARRKHVESYSKVR